MSERKTEVVNLRMSPRVKALLRVAAAHERRTLSNMLEVLIEDYCSVKGLTPPETKPRTRPTDAAAPQH
jgi:hypothetical protein